MFPPLALLLLATAAQPAAAPAAIWISRSAELALACVHKEYPNKIAHVLNGDADVKASREACRRPIDAAPFSLPRRGSTVPLE